MSFYMVLQQTILLMHLILALFPVMYRLIWRFPVLSPAPQMQRCSPNRRRELNLNQMWRPP